MLDEYSIEQRAAQIHDARTKEYFEEVLSCYSSGNYRSAVVMLWSVSVCDILFKLQNLVELYGDTKAKWILDEIKKQQEASERSPIWENKLVELVSEHTQLLDVAERENLLDLQRKRHLAAHPVFTANYELHRPNKDTTRALIRNTLDGLLIKPPILSKKIVDELVNDLEAVSEVLVEEKAFSLYLDSKYYNRFNPEVEKAVFRTLWKFVFRATDDQCTKNRAINYKAFRHLFQKNPAIFKQIIKHDPDYFSQVTFTGKPINYLALFLSRQPDLYHVLADHAKAAIKQAAENNPVVKSLAWYLSESLEEHIEKIGNWIQESSHPEISRDVWRAISEISDSTEWPKMIVSLAIKYYAASGGFAIADQRFEDYIRPILSHFDLKDCIDFIILCQKNDQTYRRGRSGKDHREVVDRAREIDLEFNVGQYELFNQWLERFSDQILPGTKEDLGDDRINSRPAPFLEFLLEIFRCV